MRFKVVIEWFGKKHVGSHVTRVDPEIKECFEEIKADYDFPELRDPSYSVDVRHVAIIEATDANDAYNAVMAAIAETES